MESQSTSISRNVRRLRKKIGYTQEQLAERAGIPRATMAGVEKDVANPTLNVIVAIADALGVAVDELLRAGDPRATLMKYDPNFVMSADDGRYQSVSMSPVDAKHVIINRVTMKPNTVYKGKRHARGSQEFFLALDEGAVVTVVDTEFVLGKGDLLYFNGDQEHSYENRGNKDFSGVAFIYYSNVIDE
jgi:DNA-binding XRE family transcriptional regulator